MVAAGEPAPTASPDLSAYEELDGCTLAQIVKASPVVADDAVTLWVTVGGSPSYGAQIGGSTTVPACLIDDAELL